MKSEFVDIRPAGAKHKTRCNNNSKCCWCRTASNKLLESWIICPGVWLSRSYRPDVWGRFYAVIYGTNMLYKRISFNMTELTSPYMIGLCYYSAWYFLLVKGRTGNYCKRQSYQVLIELSKVSVLIQSWIRIDKYSLLDRYLTSKFIEIGS